MPEVFIVYAHFPDGPSHAMKAFGSRESANQYVAKITRRPWDDEMRCETASAADTLGIAAVSVVPLPVED